MTHVVTSACMNHKYQDCVAVCPVEALVHVFQNVLSKQSSLIPTSLMKKKNGLIGTKMKPLMHLLPKATHQFLALELSIALNQPS